MRTRRYQQPQGPYILRRIVMPLIRFFGLNNLSELNYNKEPEIRRLPLRLSLDSQIPMKESRKITAQAAALLVLAAGLAFVTNAARDDRLPLVMPFPPTYQCPSHENPGSRMDLRTALNLFGRPGTAFVDARKGAAFQQGHIEGARPIPYSFVEPLSKETVDNLRGYTYVIVYCNSKDSEVSKLMAGELAQAGVKGAFYLETGFTGWVKAGGRYTGKAPGGYDG
jgi:rhodanese-related sulfurtransferase